MACGYSLSEKDTHEHCPVCLGVVHARLALSNPGACAHCRQLRRSTFERRVSGKMTLFRWMRAKSSPTTLFRRNKSQLLPRSPKQREVARWGTIPSWISTEERWRSCLWNAPPPVQKSSRFRGFYLSPVQTVVRTRLPLYLDCVAELTSSWPKPMSPPPPVPGANRFRELEGAGEAGLVSALPMRHSLAAYLAPTQNSGIAGTPTLPTGPCRFSFKQLGRIYGKQACAARTLSTVSLLQTYQAICLGGLSEAVSAGAPCDALGEVRSTADYILRATHGALVSLGHAMAGTVVSQLHHWLTLANLS